MWTLFNYLYRDASNYKVRGTLAFQGKVDRDARASVEARLEGGEFFIAEQVGVPPLQQELQASYGGRTECDHCWHSFAGWNQVEQCPAELREHGGIAQFVERFARIGYWREDLSREFCDI